MHSRPEDITVQEVSREEGEDEGEVDDCLTENITHISRASTTEGFGNTTDPSSTEGFVDPTSTEEYMESSFEEKNLHSEFELSACWLVEDLGCPPPPLACLSRLGLVGLP